MSAADRPEIVLVVARARNGVIGRGPVIPWRVPGDQKRFKQTTMGRPMIMGRKTFQSIGRALPGRDTVVLTRAGRGEDFPGATVARDRDEALALAASFARERDVDEIVIAGGGEIYAQFLDLADRLVMTTIDLAAEGDAFFPDPDPGLWRRVSREAIVKGPQDDANFMIEIYKRAQSVPKSPASAGSPGASNDRREQERE